MACKSCGQTLPLIRKGLPTIYAFGPFPGWEEVEYTDDLDNGPIQEDTEEP
jgi:hypothetical protein